MKAAHLAFAVLCVLSSVVKADVFHCTFTEPFVTVTYSMAQQTLTFDEAGQPLKKVLNGVSFQIQSAGKFALVNSQKQTVMTLNLSNQGSDGMSDDVYPFETTWSKSEDGKAQQFGGCESNLLKRKHQD